MAFHRLNTRAARAVAAGVVLSLAATFYLTSGGPEGTDRASAAPRTAATLETTNLLGDEVQPASAVPASAIVGAYRDLYSCPTLRYGMVDPVNGMDCVQLLQAALRDHGYWGQRVTGRFFNQTRQNVRDVQLRYNLPQTGNFGPLTRGVLVGPDTSPSEPSASPIPSASPASYTGHLCSWRKLVCSLYLRRTTTHTYAQSLENHKYSAAAAEAIAGTLMDAACIKILKTALLAIVCGAVADYEITDLVNGLRQANAEHACLRLSVGVPAQEGTLRLIAATPDNSSRCTD